MTFPTSRLRRLRRTESLRSFVRETKLSPDGFVYPMFVCPGEGIRKEVRSMPGVFNLSIDEAVKEAASVKALGIPSVILFGVPESKDEAASGAWAEDGIVQKATRAIKRETRDLLVMGDVCLCEYMSHGHCGIVKQVSTPAGSVATGSAAAGKAPEPEYEIVNDASLEILAKTAVSQARAGADIIAPSDMMDGRVAAIRQALDANGFQNTPVLSYAAKFASGFYGPFREAADSAPAFGDRRSYQMDPGNIREAMMEIQADLDEGADMIMVKPAIAYLDVIAEARRRFDVPLAAYQVSGEYAMIKAAAQNNWIDHDRVMMESLTSIYRAGATIILTYFAKEAARILG
ncbi:MAG TPA: porphobilinogen synthase [Clostridia bacterium]|nr:porphobilinogen synthase [Clostridia bacterium]